MENFTNILKQFTAKQRIFVLVLLLVFTSLTSVLTTYLTSDYNSCNSIVKENRELLEDYILISQLVREQQRKEAQTRTMYIRDTFVVGGNPIPTEMVGESTSMLDTIMMIAESHMK